MATVIGIFEDHYLKKRSLTVVKPGTQSRRFTHISDTIDICTEAWKKNKCLHCSIAAKETYSILEISKMFGAPIKFLPERSGERFASVLTKFNLSNKVIHKIVKINIKNYIKEFK
jgi:UDP-glucose 4-epimerase